MTENSVVAQIKANAQSSGTELALARQRIEAAARGICEDMTIIHGGKWRSIVDHEVGYVLVARW